MKPISLEAYFTDERLVKALARKRLARARQNRRLQFVSKAAGRHQQTDRDELLDLFPPRKHWPRPGRKHRQSSDDAPGLVAERLARKVLLELSQSPPEHAWVVRLRSFLHDVRTRANSFSGASEFRPTEVYAKPKGRKGNRQKYRVLSKFGLGDGLIASAYAAYFRDLIETQLTRSCWAFRSARDGEVPTHHNAVRELRQFVTTVPAKRPLWVTECDIQGFFDAVSHDVARERLLGLASEAGHAVDARALGFVDAFLAGYDYESARSSAKARLRFVERPYMFDPRSPKAPAKPSAAARVGLPQGSALSAVMANAVLSGADAACRRHAVGPSKFFYARYCDDIIIVSTRKRAAQRALRGYLGVLEKLQLPGHAPLTVGGGSRRDRRQYWRAKSKHPYRWGLSYSSDGVPWIGFLGYQLRRDGTIRIRQESVRKEAVKQRRVVDHVIGRLARQFGNRRGRANQTKVRLRDLATLRRWIGHHMISFGVGYPVDWTITPSANSVSWCRGFRLLKEPPNDRALLRMLDRQRQSALARLRGRVESLIRTLSGVERIGPSNNKAVEPQTRFVLNFPGRPLSYFAQFDGPTTR